MLTEWLMWLLRIIISLVDSLVPDWTVELPSSVATLIQTALAYDNILPVSEVLTCVSLTVGATFAMLSWWATIRVINWIMDIIP